MKFLKSSHIRATLIKALRASEQRKMLIDGLLKGASYSQYGEDLVFARIAKPTRDLFYVDVGAAYPIKYSNSFRFYLRGGRGVTIEPNPDLAACHQSLRRGDMCVNAGISENGGTLTYYRFKVADYNTFDAETAASVSRSGIQPLDTIPIVTLPLREVLQQHVGNRDIHLMSVDCEGMDLEVLRSSDWHSYRPAWLLVEDHQPDFASVITSKITNFLNANGYSMVSRISYTSLFMDSQKKELLC